MKKKKKDTGRLQTYPTSEMYRLHIGPFALQVFDDESAVAVVGRRLAAQQGRRDIEQVGIEFGLDAALLDEVEEQRGVHVPASLLFFVGVEHLLRRREADFVQVLGPAQFLQEEGQIVPFGEGRQLRDVVQSNIDQSSDAVSSELSEEVGGCGLRKTDRKDFHGDSSFASGNSSSCEAPPSSVRAA